MTQAHLIAMDLYERALTVFARRAGVDYSSPILYGGAVVEQAERLALPGQRASEGREPPPLTSILGLLYDGKGGGYYMPQVIYHAAALPLQEPPRGLQKEYGRLWDEFERDRRNFIPAGQPDALREGNLHALLQRYAWAMPAPIIVEDGAEHAVSLYDYARVSAALAVCLNDRNAEAAEPALLVGGDLSGVQEWLYTFGSRGAARSLRGRSFYLQLLMEVIAKHMLDALSLPAANLLYVGGGNFYLLAPTAKAGRIAELQQELSAKLLHMHSGALYVALAATPVSEAMLRYEDEGKIGQAWEAVNRGLKRRKAQRFAELADDAMAQAIGSVIDGTGLPRDTCAVCRRPLIADERRDVGEDGQTKCALCLSFEDLGNDLRHAEYLTMTRVEAEPGAPVIDWRIGLRQLGYDVQLVRHAEDLGEDATKGAWRNPDGDVTTVYYWKQQPDIGQFSGMPDPLRTVWAFRPLAQATPELADGRVATFEDLVSDGIARWGVLRMDVDNLGAIFQRGIPANNLCRVVGLSALMRLFFEGYAPALAQKINERTRQPRVYLMYAGGDDLFVVGGWSDLPHLAYAIRQEFGKFACNNPAITISGGISLALGDKYPLYQVAHAAGSAEAAAKDAGRNALTFLDRPLAWDTEYAQVAASVKQFVEWTGEGGPLPRSFLMTLRSVDAEWSAWRKKETGHQSSYSHQETKLYFGPWQWHLVYSLTRAAERTKDNDLKRKIDALVQSILGGEIETLGLAARWTELLTRAGKP